MAATARPGGARRGVRGAAEIDEVHSSGRGRRAGRDAHGRAGRPARRAGGASATCCSTSPARASTTRRCAPRRCRRGLHVSEYGIADDATARPHACATEEEVYELLGHAVHPAGAAREPRRAGGRARGRAARADRARRHPRRPALHTVASDGRNTIEEMAEAAQERGYDYMAITDHSATHGFGNDVQPDELLRQIERVRSVELKGFTLLAGTEVNMLPDGSLDYDGRAARAARLGRGERAHLVPDGRARDDGADGARDGAPAGRRARPPHRPPDRAPRALRVDIEQVVEAAARTGTFLEINANPDRRDLNDIYARAAAEAGVTLVIDSDAHGTDTLANIRYGVATARRGWLTRPQVANTRTWKELDKLRKRSALAPAALAPAPRPSGSILRRPGSAHAAVGGPNGELRSIQNPTPSRSSIACTAADCLRHAAPRAARSPPRSPAPAGRRSRARRPPR